MADQLLEVEELFGMDFAAGKHWEIPFCTGPCCGRHMLSGWQKPDGQHPFPNAHLQLSTDYPGGAAGYKCSPTALCCRRATELGLAAQR